MSFPQKRALVSLIATWIAAVGYAARVLRSPPVSLGQAAQMLIGAAIGLTVLMVLAHIILAIGAGTDAVRRAADQTSRKARFAAHRNAAAILVLGLCATGALGLASATPLILVQAGAAVLVLAQMTFYGSELWFGRLVPASPRTL